MTTPCWRILLSVVVISCVSCNFQSPTIPEQKELLKKKVFARDVPPWIARASQDDPSARRAPLGFIQTNFSAPGAVGEDRARLFTRDPEQRIPEIGKERREAEEVEEVEEPESGDDLE